MENKELEKNLNRIAQYDSKLSNQILMTDIDKSNINVIQNPNGEYNIVYNNFYLHSNENIEEETNRILSTVTEKTNPNVIRVVYGLGLGYLADKISELSGTIIIYEPNIDILKFVFSIATIDAIFKDNVFVCSDKQTLSDLVLKNSNIDTKLALSALPSYMVMFKDDIQEIIKTVQVAKSGHNATKNTLLAKSPAAIRNTFGNLKNILNNPNIMQLKDIYKDKTALCLSAGPSLRENIEIIKNNQDKFVIFAVNPTIKLLSQYEIKPDFIINIETINNVNQFSTINPEEYYFIMEAFTNIPTYSLKTKNTFSYISNLNFVNPWLKRCLNFEGELETLGTVSYTALTSAYLMGCKRIILCGQDLAYKNGQCYAKGSQYEELECVFDEEQNKYVIRAKDFKKYVDSLKTNEADAKRYLAFLNNNIYTIKSQDGKKIPTQTGYAIFVDWFEQAAIKLKAEKPDIELINSSTGGAMIGGFENIPLEEVVKNLETIEKPDLSNIKPEYDIDKAKLKIRLLFEKLTVYQKTLKEFLELSNKTLKEIQIKKIFTPNILKSIQKLDNMIADLAGAKKDEDIKPIIFFSLCKYSDILKDDCFDTPEKAKKTLEAIIAVSKEADNIYSNILPKLANC